MGCPDFGLKHLLPSSLLSLFSLKSVPLQQLCPQCRRNLLNPKKKASKSHLLVFSRTRGVLFLLAGSFTIGMKLIYCYTGLKYLRFCCFCSWHESVLQKEIRTGSRRWTRKTTQLRQSKCLARLLVFLTKKQADKHKACAKSISFSLWMQ